MFFLGVRLGIRIWGLNWAMIGLKQIGYDGTYAFESFVPFDKDNVWRKLASSQDELAREAIESIRAIFERNN